MIHRIDVRTSAPARGGRAAIDPLGEAIRHQIAEFGTDVGPIRTYRIFLIDSDATPNQMRKVASDLLTDPVIEEADIYPDSHANDSATRIEIHLKPGVMDPVAASTAAAIRAMGINVSEVRTGRAYLVDHDLDRAELQRIASRVLANGVIESIHFDAFVPEKFATGQPYQFKLRHVAMRDLNEDELKKLSRDGHLFLSLAEMQAIQDYFREQNREPTDIELETLAQTWSEHCVHKTLKSAVDVVDKNGNILRHYSNLIKETIFASTQQLMADDQTGFCLSVFKDNAGVIAFDETDAVCFKVETHNHPSAIEPYGGSATGVGGVIRDILGTGLAAKPVANTDVFCVADPKTSHEDLPSGVIHPRRVLRQIVAGVRDYGNRMGIPTVNGAVYFDDNYIGNPLVFCGCVGIIPRNKIAKETKSGDAIVVMGGRTGRDGIHGATFSSAELTDTHADEFSHAVQIGNAITEKQVADVLLQARDLDLFSAVTDCGAGGLSSAIGEMGEKVGAIVHLDKVPLKYAGLRYDEIWISEAQERMVLSVPFEKLDELMRLAESENVEANVIGEFGTENEELILTYNHNEVGRIAMRFMHDGIPMPTRRALQIETTDRAKHLQSESPQDISAQLLTLLASPNIASKHWIIRQYDHEVQGGSVIKPLVGPLQIGPSDASVVRPKLTSTRGVAIGCGMAPWINDPYQMTIASIDEAIRNIVCVGGDPSRAAILDNFCWPSVDDEETMGTLVAACEACRDAALAYGIPFISGKDSLHNQFTIKETGRVIRIPRTLLISAISLVENVRKCVTMDFKNENDVYHIASQDESLASLPQVHHAVAKMISSGIVRSAHDVSEGGLLVAVAEMCIASGLGVNLNLSSETNVFAPKFGEYIVELESNGDANIQSIASANGISITKIGRITREPRLQIMSGNSAYNLTVAQLTAAWRGTLDW